MKSSGRPFPIPWGKAGLTAGEGLHSPLPDNPEGSQAGPSLIRYRVSSVQTSSRQSRCSMPCIEQMSEPTPKRRPAYFLSRAGLAGRACSPPTGAGKPPPGHPLGKDACHEELGAERGGRWAKGKPLY